MYHEVISDIPILANGESCIIGSCAPSAGLCEIRQSRSRRRSVVDLRATGQRLRLLCLSAEKTRKYLKIKVLWISF